MPGSRKGEHRGNARKRTAHHETPNEIMREALAKPKPGKGARGKRGQDITTIEERIHISRIILGPPARVIDMTPKEVMLHVMHDNFQAAMDWQQMMLFYAAITPPTDESTKMTKLAEAEFERCKDRAADRARDVAPFVHAKLQAIATTPMTGENQGTVVQDLLDELDKRAREEPKVIEHIPKRKIA